MLTGGGGDKICQNLADVICERSLIVPVPCLTCRIARTFTTLARRGT